MRDAGDCAGRAAADAQREEGGGTGRHVGTWVSPGVQGARAMSARDAPREREMESHLLESIVWEQATVHALLRNIGTDPKPSSPRNLAPSPHRATLKAC